MTPRKPAVSAANGNGQKPRPAVPDGTLRLLKVLVQPVYALDTGEGLIEVSGVAVEEVNGAGWAEWAQGRFTADRLEALRKTLSIIEPQ